MTENRRIFLNIVATYGRSLFAMVCGIFTSRWLLKGLGTVDLGLYGVVGGLTAFIAFFNGILGMAVGRFYAYSVGQASVAEDREEGLEECRRWFTTAVMVHTAVPLALIAAGYPAGMWAVENWLTIPPDRLEACRWVFRCVCVSCFAGMANVPFQAMYTAKQYIAELTVYSFAATALNVCFLYYMVTHPGDWLARYALWACLVSAVPQALIACRAVKVFPECRFRRRYLWDWGRLRRMAAYAGWQSFGGLGVLFRGQGIAILINKSFGPEANAAMAMSNSVAHQADALSASMTGAFYPAITNARGAGDLGRMRAMAYRTCRVGTLLTLLFALPFALEMREVLRVWLESPPLHMEGLCQCVLLMIVIDKTAVGHMLAVNANGRIGRYQAVLGTSLILTLPVAWLFVRLGWGVYGAGYAMVFTMCLCAWGRVWFARDLVGMSSRLWFFRILLPLSALTVCAGGFGLLPRLWMGPSVARVCVTTALTEIALGGGAWAFLLDRGEKEFVIARAGRFLGHLRGGARRPAGETEEA